MDDQTKINQAKEAYYESLIKQALEELMEKEAESLLPNEKYDIVPSNRHIKRMNALFRRDKQKKAVRRAAVYIRKTAAMIIIGLGITFAALLFNPQVRAAVKQFIIEVFEQFTHISFSNSESSLGDANWHPEWLPEEFELIRETDTNEMVRLVYELNDVKIEIKYFIGEHISHAADNEQISLYSLDEEGVEYFYGDSDRSDKMNKLLWEKDNCKFIMESPLDLDTLLNIAKSVKK